MCPISVDPQVFDWQALHRLYESLSPSVARLATVLAVGDEQLDPRICRAITQRAVRQGYLRMPVAPIDLATLTWKRCVMDPKKAAHAEAAQDLLSACGALPAAQDAARAHAELWAIVARVLEASVVASPTPSQGTAG